MKSQFLLAGVAALFAGNVTLAQDPVSVDPKHHKIEFENEQVRVLRITFDPGEKAPMHEHPCAIAVGIRDGALEFTLPDGHREQRLLHKVKSLLMPSPLSIRLRTRATSLWK